jgi:Putative transposase
VWTTRRRIRAILGSLRVRARKAGLPDGRGGAVAIVQRFGSALNLNVHVHALVLDGVVAQPASGLARFVPLPAPGDRDVRVVLETARRRVLRLLRRRGLLDAPDGFIAVDELAEESPALAGISAAAVMGTAALGPRTGLRVRRGGESAEWQDREAPAPGPRQARNDGFDLHANVVAPAGDRGRLERLCRYALRPPIAQERLSFAGDGQVCLQLRRRWSDGTTHLLFDPVELLERLAAITPRPRINLILYYGVLAPRARWRSSVVPHTGPAVGDGDRCGGEHRSRAMSVPQPQSGDAPEPEEGDRNDRSSAPTVGRENRGSEWAELMRRTFGYDVLACPRCGGRLRLIALIEQTLVIQRILRHLGLQTDLPPPAPARAPPAVETARCGDWELNAECADSVT